MDSDMQLFVACILCLFAGIAGLLVGFISKGRVPLSDRRFLFCVSLSALVLSWIIFFLHSL